jgi:hypothetical protein
VQPLLVSEVNPGMMACFYVSITTNRWFNHGVLLHVVITSFQQWQPSHLQ